MAVPVLPAHALSCYGTGNGKYSSPGLVSLSLLCKLLNLSRVDLIIARIPSGQASLRCVFEKVKCVLHALSLSPRLFHKLALAVKQF